MTDAQDEGHSKSQLDACGVKVFCGTVKPSAVVRLVAVIRP